MQILIPNFGFLMFLPSKASYLCHLLVHTTKVVARSRLRPLEVGTSLRRMFSREFCIMHGLILTFLSNESIGIIRASAYVVRYHMNLFIEQIIIFIVSLKTVSSFEQLNRIVFCVILRFNVIVFLACCIP